MGSRSKGGFRGKAGVEFRMENRWQWLRPAQLRKLARASVRRVLAIRRARARAREGKWTNDDSQTNGSPAT